MNEIYTSSSIQRYMKVWHRDSPVRAAYEKVQQYTNNLEEWESEFLLVFAPALVGFVDWCLEQAIADGKERLYFLARDGYLLYQAAKEIRERKNLAIDLRYLHVSRTALRSAQYHLQGERCLDYICVGGIDITFEKIMKRTGISEELARETARRAGYEKRYQEVLGYQTIVGLKDVLRKDTAFLKAVYQIAESKYPETIGYLRQERLLEDISYGIVDTGWIGTLQQTLEQLLTSAGKSWTQPMIGYYFGLYGIPEQMDSKKYTAYYFMPWNQIRRKVYFSNSLMEAVVSSPEGMTIGYEKVIKDGKASYQPIQSDFGNPNGERINRESELLQMFLEQNQGQVILIKHIAKGLKRLMSTPTMQEVVDWGSYLFCDDVLEEHFQKVAAELKREEIKRQHFGNKVLWMLGIKKGEIHESAWLEGSIVRMGKGVRLERMHAVFYKFILYIRKAVKVRRR